MVSRNVLGISPLQHVNCKRRRVALVFEVNWYGLSHFLMVQDIANVNGVKTFVSEVKFQKIMSGGLFWRNCLNRLVQPKLSNIQNDSNQLIFRRIWSICFCIHNFLLQRAKFSYRQLNMMEVLMADVNLHISDHRRYALKTEYKEGSIFRLYVPLYLYLRGEFNKFVELGV